MILPPHLQPGDTIGIVSPSFGGAGYFPHRLRQGIRQLEALGFRVITGAHALNAGSYISDTAENRAGDINTLFKDPQVRAILSAIGGDHSCHLLPRLDFDAIRANPKIFMGFSDITVLNIAIHHTTGLVTFSGPALLTDFAENPAMFDYTLASWRKAVAFSEPMGVMQPAEEWTEEFLDWEQQKDLERPRKMLPSPGWVWLRAGRAEGRLVGGCIESLQHLRGTRYWPDFKDRIFFWETSEEKPAPEKIDGILMDYENMGVLGHISGMLVGRPVYYSDAEKEALRDIIQERTRAYHFPVITDMDFGHTSPQMTLPIGVLARIDSAQERFEIMEAAVR